VAAALQNQGGMDIHTSPLGWRVIGAAIEVHREMGPGLLESAYDKALARELTNRRIVFRQQVPIPAAYKGDHLGIGYRLDFLVENQLIVEIKANNQLAAVHRAQLRTYLRILSVRQGFLLNFNLPRLIDGLTSVLLPER